MATWKTPEHKDSHIDYVFYGMGSMLAPVIDVYHNEIIATPVTEKISDHAIIQGKIKTNIINWCDLIDAL